MKPSLSKSQLWFLAIRPKTLPAAAAPVIVGSAVAYADALFALLPALAALCGVMLLQIAVNLANDYFDAKNNIDSEDRLGPIRVTQSGLIASRHVKRVMSYTLILAALVFIYLTMVGGVPVFCVGIVSVLVAMAYSGGPYPLASHGLGELFVFIFFGLVVVCGTYYVQAHTLSWQVVVASLPPGLLVTAIMVVNNLRDIETDKKAGKHTLAVMLGRNGTVREYWILVIVAYCIPVGMLLFEASHMTILLPFVTLPFAWSLMQDVNQETGARLNIVLVKTAKLSLWFSLFFAAGLAVPLG